MLDDEVDAWMTHLHHDGMERNGNERKKKMRKRKEGETFQSSREGEIRMNKRKRNEDKGETKKIRERK